ncbi:HNH endonuclease signature motif containing protein [Paramicrobacterium agarici]|uniref:HNH endonuclease signature motif containing protein n=1 Tax=Paramicrobacterium agarici TaxID=630514 RepID=UPI00147557D3|nr:HNH endonuclease signature motif containing protein [Microbacterium agarici]
MRAAEEALSTVANLTDVDPSTLSADALLELTGLLGNIARLVEGRQVGNVGDIARRSDTNAGFNGLAARHGASSATGLFEKITGAKNSTAYRYTKLATHTTPRVSDTGLPLAPMFAQTAQALRDGVIGLDAAEAITATLAPVLPRAVPEQMDWAEATLLGNATGANGEAPVSADNLRQQARAFCAVLDPDGVEPTAEELHEARKLVFRHQENGTLKITGTLSPEQAAQVTPVFDAYMSKRTSPTFMHADEQADNEQAPEERSKPQERADVFTTIIGGTGKQKTAPKLHGRGPTVLVTVDERNLDSGTGAAWSPGTPVPLPMRFVTQMQCDGDTRHVQIDEHGEVLDLGHASREFSPKQRLALIARDGNTCAVPDCQIPAWLCEAHHIHGWKTGGRTDLSNGVLLCWWHHRVVEHGEWAIIRDETGRPRVVPPGWYVNRRYLGQREATRRDTTAAEPGTNAAETGTSVPRRGTNATRPGTSALEGTTTSENGGPPDDERDTGPRP